jgi:hypothetical protein
VAAVHAAVQLIFLMIQAESQKTQKAASSANKSSASKEHLRRAGPACNNAIKQHLKHQIFLPVQSCKAANNSTCCGPHAPEKANAHAHAMHHHELPGILQPSIQWRTHRTSGSTALLPHYIYTNPLQQSKVP